jgi:hypothetical protein
VTPRDSELLDLLRDEPGLLAIVDAAQETMRPPRRSRRLPAAALVGVAIALGIALVLFVSASGSGAGFDERALAAVGSGRIIHVQLRVPAPGTDIVTISSGTSRPENVTTDYWFDAAEHRLHAIVRRGGAVVGNTTETIEHGSSPTGAVREAAGRTALVDPTVELLVSRYRAALQSGRTPEARSSASAPLAKARWIDLAAGSGAGVSVAIDAGTHRPVAVVARGSHNGSGALERIAVFETLSARAARKEQQNMLLAAQSIGQATDVRRIPASDMRRLVSGSAAWLGPAIASIPLRAITLQRLTSGVATHRAVGATLTYASAPMRRGEVDLDHPYVTIQEAGSRETAYGFLPVASELAPVPARGELRLEREGRADQPGSAIWVAQLVRSGPLYVTIRASSRALALAAARALRTPPRS